jgi:alkylation response protein AidB-like acyl-CoA dehydrogenase
VTQDGDKFGLATAEVVEGVSTLDLSRPWGRLGPGSAAELAPAVLSSDDLASWRAFGHAVLAADLLGAARAAHTLTVGDATERTQYGRSVASFQAVQHLLAESLVLLEGAESAVNYAAWAVDVLPHDDAVDAGLVSKLYCTNAARTICEIAIQVHGGIGNTWDCMVHIYLRRVLMAGEVLGDESTLMDELVERRLQVA